MKKTFLALALVATLMGNFATTSFAHNESDTQQNDRGDSNGGDQQQTTTVVLTEADVSFTHDAASNTVTMTFADGTPMANAAVTVKNEVSGQDGDIEQNQAADANGVFDYSKWVDAGVAVLRVTAPTNDIGTGTIEYNIKTESMTIEAGKNKSGDGSGGGGTQVNASASITYMIAGGVAAVIAVGGGVAFAMQKKKKAAFAAAQAKGKKKGKANA